MNELNNEWLFFSMQSEILCTLVCRDYARSHGV